jgi:hypothetical protein
VPSEPRTRVEVFIPERLDDPAYQRTAQWLRERLARVHGGSTAFSSLVGLYSLDGQLVQDRMTLVWCDLPLGSRDRKSVEAYLSTLKEYIHTLL